MSNTSLNMCDWEYLDYLLIWSNGSIMIELNEKHCCYFNVLISKINHEFVLYFDFMLDGFNWFHFQSTCVAQQQSNQHQFATNGNRVTPHIWWSLWWKAEKPEILQTSFDCFNKASARASEKVYFLLIFWTPDKNSWKIQRTHKTK